jgi:Fe-S oxidoreductase
MLQEDDWMKSITYFWVAPTIQTGAIWNPEKAAKLARDRMSEAEEQGVDAVVSACPFCKLNLQTVTDIEVLDIIELLARSFQSDE